MREDLRQEFETKTWAGQNNNAPRSGPGSNMKKTVRLRAAFPDVFERYKIKRFLDAPCGDWFWMQHVDLSGIQYTGADISSELIIENAQKFTTANVDFKHLDITSDALPKCDMMMCRECLFHLKFWLRWAFFENFVKSGIPYLLTTVDHIRENQNPGRNAGYRPFDPRLEPFNFPEPIEIIPETIDVLPTGDALFITKGGNHRSSAIWRREQIAGALAQRPAAEQE